MDKKTLNSWADLLAPGVRGYAGNGMSDQEIRDDLLPRVLKRTDDREGAVRAIEAAIILARR